MQGKELSTRGESTISSRGKAVTRWVTYHPVCPQLMSQYWKLLILTIMILSFIIQVNVSLRTRFSLQTRITLHHTAGLSMTMMKNAGWPLHAVLSSPSRLCSAAHSWNWFQHGRLCKIANMTWACHNWPASINQSLAVFLSECSKGPRPKRRKSQRSMLNTLDLST